MEDREKRRIERRKSAINELLSRRGQLQGGPAHQPNPSAAAAEPSTEGAAALVAAPSPEEPETVAAPSPEETPAAVAAEPKREPRLKSSEETMVFVIKTNSMRAEPIREESAVEVQEQPRPEAPEGGDVFVIRTDSIRAKVEEPGKEESENVQEGSGVAQEDPGHQGQG